MSHTRPERSARDASRYVGVTRVGFRVAVLSGGRDKSALAKAADATSSADGVLTAATDVLTTTAAPPIRLTSNVVSEVLATTNTVLAKSAAAPSKAAGANSTASNNATVDGSRQHAEAPTDRRAINVVFGDATTQAAPRKPGAPDDVSRDGAAYIGSADLVRTVSDNVAPLGPANLVQTPLSVLQPMIGIADPILTSLGTVLSPVTSAVRLSVVPVTTMLGTATRPVNAIVMRSTVDALTQAVAPVATGQPAHASLISSAEVAPAVDAAAAISMTPVRVEAGTSAQRMYDRAGTGGTPVSRHRNSGAGEPNLPSDPAPLPAPPTRTRERSRQRRRDLTRAMAVLPSRPNRSQPVRWLAIDCSRRPASWSGIHVPSPRPSHLTGQHPALAARINRGALASSRYWPADAWMTRLVRRSVHKVTNAR